MPPKGPSGGARGQQQTISSFFAKRPSTSSSLSNGGTPPTQRPHQNGNKDTHSASETIDGDEVRSDRPSKRLKVSPTTPKQRPARERVEQWRFVPSKEPLSEDQQPLPSSSQRSQQEDERHEAFRKKLLGSNDPIRRYDQAARAAEERERAGGEELFAGGDEDDDDDDQNGLDETREKESGKGNAFQQYQSQSRSSSSASRSTKSNKPGPSTPRYTPLELQVIDLKKQHPDVLLLFEVGYKFIAYNEDAVNASKELNVMCFPKQNMRIASIPVHRLHIHARRLVKAGYKVGVVRQTETRALKKAGNNASTPFTRELKELFTASTWVEDLETVGSSESAGENPAAQNSLVALVERLEGGNYGKDERVSIGLIAVQAATGAVVYDQFVDSSMRSELETRLAHLQPAELLLPPADRLSKPTEKMLRYLAGNPSSSASVGMSSTRLRIERTDGVMSYNDAFAKVTAFYESLSAGSSTATQGAALDDSVAGQTLATIMKLPHQSIIALATCIEHLKSFGLDSIFTVASSFVSFQARSEMLLSTGTLYNLELFSTTEGTHKGSLVWLLDKCKTIFGKRMLRRWIGRPLTDLSRLQERSAAVSELLEGRHHLLAQIPEILTGQPDLEKGLARMLYGRATTNEVATIILALNRITTQFAEVQNAADVGLDSPLLNECIAALPRTKHIIAEALSVLNLDAARKGEKENMFREDKFPELQDEKDQIAVVEADLVEHLGDLRKTLKRPALQYKTVAGIEYLVEIAVGDAKKMPADWLRISATKSAIRYHTPTVIQALKSREQHKELLASAANDAFNRFLAEICQDSAALRATIAALGTLDALISLASVASLPGYVKPEFQPGQGYIEVEGLRHPMSELLRDEYVPNDVRFDAQEKSIVLTGANMGGKSSTVRAIALCVILGQIGSHVPATSAKMSLFDAVLTRMGASDELAKGRSTFMVEAEEAAEIMRSSTSKSLVILDEMGRGTSTFDGQAIASSILTHLSTREVHRRPTTLFITHYTSLCALADRLPGVRNMHMAFIERDRGDGSGGKDVVFLYKLRDGPASSSFGIHCASLAGLPRGMLETATQRAIALEETTEMRTKARRETAARKVLKCVFGAGLSGEGVTTIEQAALKMGIERDAEA
ncbi:unnamed protein product [Jaminaea pallidilutea]